MAKSDYDNRNKQDLEAENAALKAEIVALKKRKKFGLVWEDKTEEVVDRCRRELPVLEEVKSLAIAADADAPTNLLIEGDNYHALSVLNYTHAGKIDVIYIDPPYNRGGDLYFNDGYVDKEDGFRHSKWLSFMDKRIRLAKTLMHQGGVMFVSIDDSEQGHLRLLLNEIFGEENVDVMIWRKSGYGRDGKMKNTTTFRKDHEYVIVCFRRDKQLNKIHELPDFQNKYGNPDGDPRGPYKEGSISRREDASNPNHKNFYTVVSPTGKEFTRQFDCTKEEFDALCADVAETAVGEKVGRIRWGNTGGSVPRIKVFLNEKRYITPYSVLLKKGTTTEGTKEVNKILERDLSKMRPKPVHLIETLVQLADKRKGLVVLDFFAGSGTTGHAVSLLNKEDGGNRRFILCTNSENRIAREVCYPRIKAVIEGHKDLPELTGIPSNLRYFKTAFVAAAPTDKNKIRLTEKAAEMLCVRENTFAPVKINKTYRIYGDGNGRFTGIVYDPKAIGAFKKAAAKLDGKFAVYIFSFGDDDFADEFADMRGKVRARAIPEDILNAYWEIFGKGEKK